MLTVEVRRRPGTGAEMHRVTSGSATVGASSGNEIVVRARGVYGRHVRLFERDGAYHLDLFKGIETVQVNGRDFFGGQITVGDRITIGEATITVVEASTAARARGRGRSLGRGVRARPLRRRWALRSRSRRRACRSPRSSTGVCGSRCIGSAATRRHPRTSRPS